MVFQATDNVSRQWSWPVVVSHSSICPIYEGKHVKPQSAKIQTLPTLYSSLYAVMSVALTFNED